MRIGMPSVMMACALAATLAVVGSAGAQTDGSVTYDMGTGANAGGDRTMIMHFHGSQELVDVPGMGSMLMDASTGTRTVLMRQQKMYLQMSAADLPQQPANANVSVTKDGSETVAGIPCTDYKITSGTAGQDVYEVCAAPGVPSMDPKLMMNGPLATRMGLNPQIASVMQQLSGKGALKLYKIDGTTKTVVMQATKVDPTPPDPSLFEIPKDYTKFQAPPGMQGMPGMPGAAQPKSP